MNWARKMADKKKLNEVLVRCKNSRHENKRRKYQDREVTKELRNYV